MQDEGGNQNIEPVNIELTPDYPLFTTIFAIVIAVIAIVVLGRLVLNWSRKRHESGGPWDFSPTPQSHKAKVPAQKPAQTTSTKSLDNQIQAGLDVWKEARDYLAQLWHGSPTMFA